MKGWIEFIWEGVGIETVQNYFQSPKRKAVHVIAHKKSVKPPRDEVAYVGMRIEKCAKVWIWFKCKSVMVDWTAQVVGNSARV